jgi:hypothetical protein
MHVSCVILRAFRYGGGNLLGRPLPTYAAPLPPVFSTYSICIRIFALNVLHLEIHLICKSLSFWRFADHYSSVYSVQYTCFDSQHLGSYSCSARAIHLIYILHRSCHHSHISKQPRPFLIIILVLPHLTPTKHPTRPIRRTSTVGEESNKL